MSKEKCSFSSSTSILDEDAWRMLSLYARCMRVIGLQRRFRSPQIHAEVLAQKRVRDALLKAYAEHGQGAIDGGSIRENMLQHGRVKRSKWRSIKARTLVLLGDVAEKAAFKRLTEYQLQSFVS